MRVEAYRSARRDLVEMGRDFYRVATCGQSQRDGGAGDAFPFYSHAGRKRLTPGKVYKAEIPLEPIAYRFR